MRVPDHVPPELVVDFDFYNIPGIEGNVQNAWKSALPDLPIIYTPRNTGHWVFTRAEDIERMLRDSERLCNTSILIPPPQGDIKVLPEQSDPPDHAFYRGSVAKFFTADLVAKREEEIRALTVELIEGLKPRGECEFIRDFAGELPIVVFLKIMALPLEHRAALRASAVKMVRGSDAQAKTEGFLELQTYIAECIKERRASPREDIISNVVVTNTNGRQMQYDEALGLCSALLLGGLDTLASMVGLISRHLAESPEDRRFIRENRSEMPRIVQELTRRFALVSVTRVVKVDQEYKGVRLKKGDLVLLPTMLHSMDERRFGCPTRVDYERKNAPNATFGSGIHTCIGNVLARAEIKIFLEEWLMRIPEFSLKAGHKPLAYSGPISGLHELWLEWPKPSLNGRS